MPRPATRKLAGEARKGSCKCLSARPAAARGPQERMKLCNARRRRTEARRRCPQELHRPEASGLKHRADWRPSGRRKVALHDQPGLVVQQLQLCRRGCAPPRPPGSVPARCRRPHRGSAVAPAQLPEGQQRFLALRGRDARTGVGHAQPHLAVRRMRLPARSDRRAARTSARSPAHWSAAAPATGGCRASWPAPRRPPAAVCPARQPPAGRARPSRAPVRPGPAACAGVCSTMPDSACAICSSVASVRCTRSMSATDCSMASRCAGSSAWAAPDSRRMRARCSGVRRSCAALRKVVRITAAW